MTSLNAGGKIKRKRGERRKKTTLVIGCVLLQKVDKLC